MHRALHAKTCIEWVGPTFLQMQFGQISLGPCCPPLRAFGDWGVHLRLSWSAFVYVAHKCPQKEPTGALMICFDGLWQPASHSWTDLFSLIPDSHSLQKFFFMYIPKFIILGCKKHHPGLQDLSSWAA